MTQIDGFLVIDKPAGVTSHDVVAQVRRRFGTRQVGHAGTLDPMATGVLVIGLNRATKFLQYIVAGKKSYLGTIRLGERTTTDDREGEVIERSDISSITDESIRAELAKFIGKIAQVPSSVSAIKISGERAYDLVRKGEAVELPPREVEIYDLRINAIRRSEYLDVDIEVTCSPGTYIRAIARDLGAKLEVGGHLIQLRRTVVAPFRIDQARAVESAEPLPLNLEIAKVLPTRSLSVDEISELRFGRKISPSEFTGVGVALSAAGEVVAIIENQETGAQPMTVFNP